MKCYYKTSSWFLLLFVLTLLIETLCKVSSFQLRKIPYKHCCYSSTVLASSRSEEFPFVADDNDDDLYGAPSFLGSHQRSSLPSTKPRSLSSSARVNARTRVVWIIDDEQPILDAVGSYLASVGGYEVYPFLNATLPLALLSQSQSQGMNGRNNNNDHCNSHVVVPDAIISDIRMPHISGIDLLAMIRSSKTNSILNMPFILLTARSLVEDRVRSYDAGTDGYLMKPFDPEELVVLLERIIQRKEWLEESVQSSVTLEELKDDLDEIKEALLKEEANLYLNGFLRGGEGARGRNNGYSTQDNNEDMEYMDSSNDDDDFAPLLNPDEMDVLELLCQGYMNKEIASELQYSIRWVERQLTTMYRKTGCANRTELVRWAIANDFVDM